MKQTTGERILSEPEVHRMLALSVGWDVVLLRNPQKSSVVGDPAGLLIAEGLADEIFNVALMVGAVEKVKKAVLDRKAFFGG